MPTVLVDFDGVIHRYSAGWKDGSTYDSPMPGAKEALKSLTDEGYEVVIFSTRDSDQIVKWLEFWDFPEYKITNEKIPAVAIIDDRAIRFVNWGLAIGLLHKHHPIKKENN
jgi:hypothetical protein